MGKAAKEVKLRTCEKCQERLELSAKGLIKHAKECKGPRDWADYK